MQPSLLLGAEPASVLKASGERQPMASLPERKIPHRQQGGGARCDFSPPQMTQPSSLSGKLILQQSFKWPLHLQSLPRQPTHSTLPDSSSPAPFHSCHSPAPPRRRQRVKRQVLVVAFGAPDVRAPLRTCYPFLCTLSSGLWSPYLSCEVLPPLWGLHRHLQPEIFFASHPVYMLQASYPTPMSASPPESLP